jgi:hypothetical protein
MTNLEFRAALDALGYGQSEFARLTGHDASTVRRWISGAPPVPRRAEVLLQTRQNACAEVTFLRALVRRAYEEGALHGERIGTTIHGSWPEEWSWEHSEVRRVLEGEK